MSMEPLDFGMYYHIYNRGVNGQSIFPQKRNYQYFLKLYAKYLAPVAQTFAYSLLPNHYHFALRTLTKAEQRERKPFGGQELIVPSRAFNNMFIAYTKAVNKAVGRTGPLFERPFRRKQINSADYFQNLIVYIHQNPQKHGYVDDFRDWKYSSWGAYQVDSVSQLARQDVFDWFGGKTHLAQAHQERADEDSILYLIQDDLDWSIL